MDGVEQVKDTVVGAGYMIPADLMHLILMGLFGALLSIGAYIVLWAIADAKHKTQVMTRLGALEELIKLHDSYRAEHDRLAQRVDHLREWRREHISRHVGRGQ